MSKRAVLYARVSSDDRKNEGRNLNSQLEICREYALNKGWEIVAELAEDERGTSGSGSFYDLPAEISRAIEMAHMASFDVLVVRELDRLARNLGKQLALEEQFVNYGISVEYVVVDFEDSPEGVINKQLRGMIAEYEAYKIKQRMERARRREVKRGSIIVHGRPPYGYDLHHDGDKYQLIINELQAKVVKMIYDWYAYGVDGESVTMHWIANELARMGIKPPSGKVTTISWPKITVRRILTSETYAGVWHYGKAHRVKKGQNKGKQHVNSRDQWIAVEVPAIVDRETWEIAQKKRAVNKANSSRNKKRDYLLTGRVYCIHCGHKMCAIPPAKTRKYHYFRCNAAYSSTYGYSAHCEIRKYFRGDYADEIAWHWVRSFFLNPELLEEGYQNYLAELNRQHAPLQNQLETISCLLSEKEAEYQRLIDLYISGEVEKGMLVDRKNNLEKMISSLQNEHRELSARLAHEQLTAAQLQNIQEFICEVGEGLLESDENIKTKRKYFDQLKLKIRLGLENGKEIIELECVLGEMKGDLNELSSRTI